MRGAGLRRIALTACALFLIGGSAASALAADEPTAATVAVDSSESKIAYGELVRVTGRVEPAGAGRRVSVQYAPRGGAYRTVKTAKTDAGGRFAARVRPPHSGALRAVPVDGRTAERRPVTVSARLSGRARMDLRRGQSALVSGALRPAISGRGVQVQIAGRRDGWRTVERTSTRDGGRFKASWKATRTGTFRVRVRFTGDGRNAAASRTLKGAMSVYRPGHASWYGPGFYGNRTACGRTLGSGTIGVAHKSLPCGTRVKFRYGNRTVVAPVIDRGPYAAGREWDLTGATKRRLGFPSTGTVWSTK